MSVLVDREQKIGTIYFSCVADRDNTKLATQQEVQTEFPMAFHNQAPVTQYDCSACTFLNEIHDTKCVQCDTAAPEWVTKVLDVLERETLVAEAAVVVKIELHAAWKM